jgi:hypothetical protein
MRLDTTKPSPPAFSLGLWTARAHCFGMANGCLSIVWSKCEPSRILTHVKQCIDQFLKAFRCQEEDQTIAHAGLGSTICFNDNKTSSLTKVFLHCSRKRLSKKPPTSTPWYLPSYNQKSCTCKPRLFPYSLPNHATDLPSTILDIPSLYPTSSQQPSLLP